jgi:hypothetical protein
VDQNVSEEDVMDAGITVKDTTFFDSTANGELFNMSAFITEQLRKEFHLPQLDTIASFGLIETGAAIHEDVHTNCPGDLDYAHKLWKTGTLLEKSWKIGYTLFLPLMAEGMAIRLLYHDGNSHGECPDPRDFGNMVLKPFRINFGSALLIRNDIAHSGHYGSIGNVRMFCTIRPYPRDVKYKLDDPEIIPRESGYEDLSHGISPIEILYKAHDVMHAKGRFRYFLEYINEFFYYDIEYMRNIFPRFTGNVILETNQKTFSCYFDNRTRNRNKKVSQNISSKPRMNKNINGYHYSCGRSANSVVKQEQILSEPNDGDSNNGDNDNTSSDGALYEEDRCNNDDDDSYEQDEDDKDKEREDSSDN